MIVFYFPLISRKINFVMWNYLLYTDHARKAFLLCGNLLYLFIYLFLILEGIRWERILNLKELGGWKSIPLASVPIALRTCGESRRTSTQISGQSTVRWRGVSINNGLTTCFQWRVSWWWSWLSILSLASVIQSHCEISLMEFFQVLDVCNSDQDNLRPRVLYLKSKTG